MLVFEHTLLTVVLVLRALLPLLGRRAFCGVPLPRGFLFFGVLDRLRVGVLGRRDSTDEPSTIQVEQRR